MGIYSFNFDTTYTDLPQHFFSYGKPDIAQSPRALLTNDTLAHTLGMDLSILSAAEQAQLLTGRILPTGVKPFSQAYAGHQFGHFTMLGDGRAHILGEHVTPEGIRYDVQLKGSGQTPYSRSGDGKAALGPMLREYIISEAMHYLNIPTTRSLAVTTTGEDIARETMLPGAILTRIASSHIRVGTFEYAAALQDTPSLDALLKYTINRHYPDIAHTSNPALALLERCMEKQLDLIVNWMRVGFIHGVMNTDNMSIVGETIDYGPCAFMDHYNPQTVFSSIDKMGRYAYANQAQIAQWNLTMLAKALLPCIDNHPDKALDLAKETIAAFSGLYKNKWLHMMRSKLGFLETYEEDEGLITALLECMHTHNMDYTNTFRDLSQDTLPNQAVYQSADFTRWHHQWQRRLEKNKQAIQNIRVLMRQTNPAMIPRNHIVEQVLQAAHNADNQPMLVLLAALKQPYEDSDIAQPFQQPPTSTERVNATFCGT